VTATAFRSMRAAVVFLTRIPVGTFGYRAVDFAWAPAHFPLVGALLGLAYGALCRALFPLGGLAASTLTIAASLLVTGAFHEDGFADTSDALGGAYDRAKVLVILKDSRVGTFGASAVVISIVGRAVLVAPLVHDASRVVGAFVLAGAAARVGPVWLMACVPYAEGTSDAAKSGDVRASGVPQAIVATAWLVAIVGTMALARVVTLSRIVALVVILSVVTVVCGLRFARRLGGLTGDFLGATEQLCELAAFAVLAWDAP
jgi:adenosylcobinamide-GDP ribazoletransferase